MGNVERLTWVTVWFLLLSTPLLDRISCANAEAVLCEKWKASPELCVVNRLQMWCTVFYILLDYLDLHVDIIYLMYKVWRIHQLWGFPESLHLFLLRDDRFRCIMTTLTALICKDFAWEMTWIVITFALMLDCAQ